jgi:PhnB protein
VESNETKSNNKSKSPMKEKQRTILDTSDLLIESRLVGNDGKHHRVKVPLRELSHQPTWYPSAMNYRFSAMLHIPGDVRDAIAFYERAFGATTGWSTPPAANMVAQLLAHGAEFWVHPADKAIGNPSAKELGGTAVRLMLIVDDPDVVFDQALAAGALVRSPMQDHDYGWRDGSVVDPSGHRWEIGKPL